MDPLGFASVDVTASVTPQGDVPDDEKFHLTAQYNRWPWKVSAFYNPADFYDFFGPTKRSRKGYGAVGEYAGVIINDRPRSMDYAINLAAFAGLDELPQYQGVPATLSEYVAASGHLDYQAYRKTIGGLGPEKGISWRLTATDKLAEGDHYPRLWGDFNWIVPLPLDHSTLWIRPGAGYSWGDRDNTLSNFYFGGFGNNWVDWQEVRRYREYYALPGLDISQLEANNYGKLLVEWGLPPLRFKQAGTAEPLLHLDECRDLRHRHRHRPRRLGIAPGGLGRGRPAGLQAGPVLEHVGHLLHRVRQGLGRQWRDVRRGHAVAEDPVI